jgi:glutamate/tyrosine decarboxylase-like PLP-dependent enzyme
MHDLLHNTAARAGDYLAGLENRRIFPTAEAIAQLTAFDEPLPEYPTDPAHTITLLDDIGSPATVATAGGRYFGFVTGSTLPACLAVNWLAGAWDQMAGMRVASPVGAAVEAVALRWLLDVLQLPAAAAVGFVTGATMANFTGLAAARHAALAKLGWDVEAQGLFSAPPITVIVGEEVHVSLLKTLSLLGLGRERVVRVPVDGQGRMRAGTLPAISGPTIVCIQAGNVNTGAFDPAHEICAVAHEAGAWVHVDGAFGLWAAAAPQRAHLAAGVHEADSWATDAHKWLNVPYDSGLVFCREAQHLRAAMATTAAAYLVMEEQREPMHYTPESSRRARGLEVWAALRSLGRSGLAELIDRCCRHAARFAKGLREAGYDILNEVQLNQVLVSFGSAEKTRRVITAVQEDGTCWCGGTVWQGHTAMRISVSSWATTEEDVEKSLAAIVRLAREIGD